MCQLHGAQAYHFLINPVPFAPWISTRYGTIDQFLQILFSLFNDGLVEGHSRIGPQIGFLREERLAQRRHCVVPVREKGAARS
jgi:hypothetical protein